MQPLPTVDDASDPCPHEGAVLEWCHGCKGGSRHVRECDVHDKCTREYVSDLVESCDFCDNHPKKGNRAVTKIRWSYGVTTVPERRESHLPRTLASLRRAGFDSPTLFVDGHAEAESYRDEFKLEVVARWPRIRTFGNWTLALAELYIRNPDYERFALFQDDFVTVLGLREYLSRVPYPEKSYLNLFTMTSNERVKPPGTVGWFPSNQYGRGAVALVFDNLSVVTLLTSLHMVERPKDVARGWKAIDGGIVTALKKAGWTEYVHSPSLVQHTGKESSMGNREHRPAPDFRGEDWDVRTLLKEGEGTTVSRQM